MIYTHDNGILLIRQENPVTTFITLIQKNIPQAASRFSFFLSWGFKFQAADAVFRAIGSRWSVPWTAETIMQVSVSIVYDET